MGKSSKKSRVARFGLRAPPTVLKNPRPWLKGVFHLDNCCRACRETPNDKLYSTESSLNKISARFKV